MVANKRSKSKESGSLINLMCSIVVMSQHLRSSYCRWGVDSRCNVLKKKYGHLPGSSSRDLLITQMEVTSPLKGPLKTPKKVTTGRTWIWLLLLLITISSFPSFRICISRLIFFPRFFCSQPDLEVSLIRCFLFGRGMMEICN